MALLLTAEQVLAVRVRNSKPFRLEELSLDLLIVKMSAAAAMDMQKLHEKAEQGEATNLPELTRAVLQASCADSKGELLDKEAVDQILGLMSVDAMNALVTAVNPSKPKPDDGKAAPAGNVSGPAST